MNSRYDEMLNNMILRLNEQGHTVKMIAYFTGLQVQDVEKCIEQSESTYDHEISIFLDQIKEEFFDNGIRAYKLTKMGLIDLEPYIQPGKLLEFYRKLKDESVVIELKE